jgi:DNA modification methylase
MTSDKCTIHVEGCLATLARMPDNSIDCCITSPPYYGLRDYGMDEQIGLEETPEAYVQKLVDVFREVRRVLKPTGTLWLNLGDSYNGSGKGGDYGNSPLQRGNNQGKGDRDGGGKAIKIKGLKPKDLIGIPWMVAFALRADGWWLRQDIIWNKPNPMPESVTDRCTKAHEYIFLMSKSAKYYYDAEAVKEPLRQESIIRNQSGWNGNENRGYPNGMQNNMSKYLGSDKAKEETHRNKRSVWTVTTKPFKEAHFATYPEELIEPCVLAGCPENGVIYDPFTGAATTGLVALRANRRFIGSELNPEYAKIAEKRLEFQIKQLKLF